MIKKLIDAKLLYQQQTNYRTNDGRDIEAHNIVFPIYDETRTIVGAETAGILIYSDMRFKGVEKGSKYGYGYNILANLVSGIPGPAQKLYFFGSAVDLISFIELEKKDNELIENGHRGEFVIGKKPVKSGKRILEHEN